MENPLSGVMEWYQGLPQAAQIGIPVVGVGAVYLIAKGGKHGGVGSLVSGPFGSSTGGGQAVSGAGNAGGSTGGGTTGSGNVPPAPKPINTRPTHHPHPIPKPAPGHSRPLPPASHYSKPPQPVSRGNQREPVGGKAETVAKPHLPSSHIQSKPAAKGHLPASHISSTSRAVSVGYLPAQTPKTPIAATRSGKLYEGGPTIHGSGKGPIASRPTMSPPKHPVNSRALGNRVPATKTHQVTHDKNKLAANALTAKHNTAPRAL